MAFSLHQITKMVVVLMPPPVEAGEAPINMKKIASSWLAVAASARFTVLKPAVR